METRCDTQSFRALFHTSNSEYSPQHAAHIQSEAAIVIIIVLPLASGTVRVELEWLAPVALAYEHDVGLCPCSAIELFIEQLEYRKAIPHRHVPEI